MEEWGMIQGTNPDKRVDLGNVFNMVYDMALALGGGTYSVGVLLV